MEGKRFYLQPAGLVYDTILDIVELQKGKIILSDAARGIIHFRVSMYGFRWELKFEVTDIGKNRSLVKLEIGGDRRDKEKEIRREFSLLDSMLLAGAMAEMAEK